MLTVTNLHVRAGNREILRGIDLSINAGEVHAIMGPNGSGKSTLARVLAGHPEYEVTAGTATYEGNDLLAMDPETRARQGVFMAFQYPVEIPGVNNAYFLKAALNALRKHRGQDELDAMEFMSLVRQRMQVLHIDETLLEYVETETDGFRILVRDSPVASTGGTFASMISDIATQVEHVLAGEFKQRGYDPKFAALYSQALVGMVALTGQWRLDERKPKREAVATTIVNLVWNGLKDLQRP